MSPANDIVAHDSGDSGAHTMRKRQEIGQTKNATVPPIDHAKNLVEDSALLEGPNLGDESNHRGIEDHSSERILLIRWKLGLKQVSLKFYTKQAKSSLSRTSPFLI